MPKLIFVSFRLYVAKAKQVRPRFQPHPSKKEKIGSSQFKYNIEPESYRMKRIQRFKPNTLPNQEIVSRCRSLVLEHLCRAPQ